MDGSVVLCNNSMDNGVDKKALIEFGRFRSRRATVSGGFLFSHVTYTTVRGTGTTTLPENSLIVSM